MGKIKKQRRVESWWEDISPKLAEEYLELNTITNRQLSEGKVEEWAEEILAGKWMQTHQGIAFDWDANLIDGQHRLRAIIKSGKTVRMLVTSGLDPDAFRVIDDGMARNSSNVFFVLFKKRFGSAPVNVNRVTAIASGMLTGCAYEDRKKVHKEEVAEHALKHYKLIQDVLPGLCSKADEVWGTAAAAALTNACLYFGRERVMPLVERCRTQMWVSTTDPLKTLHARLTRAKIREQRGDRLTIPEKYGLTVTAIRAVLAGQTRTKLEGTKFDFGTIDFDKKLKRGEKVERIVEPAPVAPTKEPAET